MVVMNVTCRWSLISKPDNCRWCFCWDECVTMYRVNNTDGLDAIVSGVSSIIPAKSNLSVFSFMLSNPLVEDALNDSDFNF